MTHSNPRWRLLAALPFVLVLGGCGTTVLLDNFNTGAIGASPAQPNTGSSTSSGSAVVAAHPQNPGSADHWLRLSRTSPTQAGGEYIGSFTQNVANSKVSVDLVAFVPKSAPIMFAVFFEPKTPLPQIPLMHIDLLPNGNIRVNDSQVVGTFKFDHLVGFFINFNLTGPSPTAEILIRGGGTDASTTIAVPVNAANFGLGRVRIFAPFEGVNAPNGSFLVNDIIAIKPD